MATIRVSATMFARRAVSTTNAQTTKAVQGYTTANGLYVGVLYFSGLDMSEKIVKSIKFYTTCNSSAGLSNTHVKKMGFYASTAQNLTRTASGKGSSFVGAKLGAYSGLNLYNASNKRRNTQDTDDSDDEWASSALFEDLKAYLEAGNNTLILYSTNDSPYGSYSYSRDYLYMDGFDIEIEYEEGIVNYGVGGAYKRCLAYYGVGGVWKRVMVYLGRDGEWKRTGG